MLVRFWPCLWKRAEVPSWEVFNEDQGKKWRGKETYRRNKETRRGIEFQSWTRVLLYHSDNVVRSSKKKRKNRKICRLLWKSISKRPRFIKRIFFKEYLIVNARQKMTLKKTKKIKPSIKCWRKEYILNYLQLRNELFML